MSGDRSDWICSSCGKYSDPQHLDYQTGKCWDCQDSHLHPDILRRIQEQKKKGGIELDKLEVGTMVEAKTRNSLYKIKALGNGKFMVQGGTRMPEPIQLWIAGSTWGGSMIKHDWLGVDMHIEMQNPNPEKMALVTSAVESLKIIAPDGSWEYEIS